MFQEFIEIFILSAVQGISEFLPISSSAHLILVSKFYELKTASLIIDISLHLGSLLAIIFYFRKDLVSIKNDKKILNLILFGSIPLIFFGYIVYASEVIYHLRNIKVIAFTTFLFGLILFYSDQKKVDKNISVNLNLRSILFIGFFQILALIPGVSRAGITLTAARFLGFSRVESSKIAFFLSIPALAGASFLNLKDMFQQSFEINFLVISAVFLSFVFSYITIKYFLIFINKFSLNVFVIYRLLISLILFFIIY